MRMKLCDYLSRRRFYSQYLPPPTYTGYRLAVGFLRLQALVNFVQRSEISCAELCTNLPSLHKHPLILTIGMHVTELLKMINYIRIQNILVHGTEEH